jgi:putative glutamine amidotransferase
MKAQQTRPLIGINADYVPATKIAGAQIRLNVGYFEAVQVAGGLPVIIPPLAKEAELNAFLDQIDGVILTGGLDMDPRRYGQPTHPAVQPMPERREENDRILVKLVVQRKMPVLGIALGMHQLNAACGGSLYLHLPEEQPRAMPHSDPTCHGPHRHAVLIEPNTRVDEIYGGGEIRVNSAHHQAVRVVGSKLKTSALAPDGIIEAVESVDPNWFCIGVQWHPESETASALDMQLFECFIQASLRQAQPLELAVAA